MLQRVFLIHFRRLSLQLKLRTGVLLGVTSILVSGCSSLGIGYLIQAGRGQLELSNRARPVEEVIRDSRTSQRIRTLLGSIPEIKKWGEYHGLKATQNYTQYVALNRNAAVYVVSASKPLKFEPYTWSFPIVGSFTYVGWFSEAAAGKYANQVKQTGLDVDVRGASAYSTLGWFRDPILSTMIREGDYAFGDLAETILHESVHATVYIKGQSYFNESLAEFVAQKMVRQYLRESKGEQSSELLAYLKGQEYSEKYTKTMHEAYSKLDALYHSLISDAEKLEQKRALLEQVRADLQITRPINNATLIQFKTYGTAEAEFTALLEACGGEISQFLNRVGRLRDSDFDQPQSEAIGLVLLAAAKTGC